MLRLGRAQVRGRLQGLASGGQAGEDTAQKDSASRGSEPGVHEGEDAAQKDSTSRGSEPDEAKNRGKVGREMSTLEGASDAPPPSAEATLTADPFKPAPLKTPLPPDPFAKPNQPSTGGGSGSSPGPPLKPTLPPDPFKAHRMWAGPSGEASAPGATPLALPLRPDPFKKGGMLGTGGGDGLLLGATPRGRAVELGPTPRRHPVQEDVFARPSLPPRIPDRTEKAQDTDRTEKSQDTDRTEKLQDTGRTDKAQESQEGAEERGEGRRGKESRRGKPRPPAVSPPREVDAESDGSRIAVHPGSTQPPHSVPLAPHPPQPSAGPGVAHPPVIASSGGVGDERPSGGRAPRPRPPRPAPAPQAAPPQQPGAPPHGRRPPGPRERDADSARGSEASLSGGGFAPPPPKDGGASGDEVVAEAIEGGVLVGSRGTVEAGAAPPPPPRGAEGSQSSASRLSPKAMDSTAASPGGGGRNPRAQMYKSPCGGVAQPPRVQAMAVEGERGADQLMARRGTVVKRKELLRCAVFLGRVPRCGHPS